MKAAWLALVLTLPAVAGCIATDLDGANVPDPRDLVSQVLYGDVIAEHTPIVSFDGTVLDAWVFRPDTSETGEAVPVIINFSPYWSNLAPPAATGGDAYSLHLIDFFVPRGYSVALVSARGTGLSEGCFTIGGPLEIRDVDVAATFLATQPWANGNVTAVAKSYDGTMAQALITTGNPHVKTIMPVSAISELYKYNYFHGVPYTFGGQVFNTYYVALVSLAQQTDPQDETYGMTATRFCDESLDVQLAQYQSTTTGVYTPYWQARNYSALLPEHVPSVFYIHGLQDWNVKPDHMIPWIEELHARDVPVKMWLGQWKHDYPTRDDWNTTSLRWFDHWLKGIDTGIMDEPLVQVQDTDGVWRHENDWPVTRAERDRMHTSMDGTLSADAGTGTSSYRDVPIADERVVFRSAPFAEAQRLVGEPLFHALVSATGARATMTATLRVDDKVVTQGFLDLTLRDGLDQTKPMTPGEQAEVLVRFFPQDVVIPAGSVLSLTLSHASQPGSMVSVTPVPTGATVTIHHGDATWLELPLIGFDDVRIEAPQPTEVECWAC